eukprot:Nk52_evm51s208 gene=Nk52_evmTU51s208
MRKRKDWEGRDPPSVSANSLAKKTRTKDKAGSLLQPAPLLQRDALLVVFSFLDPVSLATAARVCTLWDECAKENCLWQEHFFKFFDSRFGTNGAVRKSVLEMSGVMEYNTKVMHRDALIDGASWKRGQISSRVTVAGAHRGPVRAMGFYDAASTIFASAGRDQVIHLWDSSSFSDSETALEAFEDVNPFRTIPIGEKANINCLQFLSKSGKPKLFAGVGKNLRLFNLALDECSPVMSYGTHSDSVFACDQNSSVIATAAGQNDKSLRVWDIETGAMIFKRTMNGSVRAVKSYGNEEHIFITGSLDKALRVFDTRMGGESILEIPLQAGIHSLSTNQKYVLATTGSPACACDIYDFRVPGRALSSSKLAEHFSAYGQPVSSSVCMAKGTSDCNFLAADYQGNVFGMEKKRLLYRLETRVDSLSGNYNTLLCGCADGSMSVLKVSLAGMNKGKADLRR